MTVRMAENILADGVAAHNGGGRPGATFPSGGDAPSSRQRPMKSEERHQLQEMELEKWGRKAKSFWQNYGATTLMAVAALCLVIVAVIWMRSSAAAARQTEWAQMVKAEQPQDFADIANEHEGSLVGHWARLRQAELTLAEGIGLSFDDRSAAIEELAQARKAFNTLIKQEDLPPQIQERGLYGFARCLETLASVDLKEEGENVEGVEPAIEAYQAFVEKFPESPYTPTAERRIEALKREETQEFLAWFKEQNPNPKDRSKPNDPIGGLPGAIPMDDTNETGYDALEEYWKNAKPAGAAEATPPKSNGEAEKKTGEEKAAPKTGS